MIKSGLFFRETFTINNYSSSEKDVQQNFWMRWINVCNVKVLQGNRWVTLYGLGPEEQGSGDSCIAIILHCYLWLFKIPSFIQVVGWFKLVALLGLLYRDERRGLFIGA
jgi:hypothetical protein